MDDVTLALEMQHMSASLLPHPVTNDGGSCASHTDTIPHRYTDLRSANPPLLGLNNNNNRSSILATSLQSLDSSNREQLPELIEERLLGLLGEYLSDVDRNSVQLVPLRTCLRGEIVAVEDNDGVLRYGKVMEDEDPTSSGEVKVQVSKACIRWYAVSRIYFFQSVSKGAGVWAGKQPALTEIQGEDSADSSVSDFGVIAAVNTLLARLNVSLSTSYEELLAEMLRLQHRARFAEEDRRAALKQIERAIREKRDAEKALVCVVCLVNNVDRVLIPCGHSYCAACVVRLHQDCCPVCRQEIADSVVFRVS